MEIRMDAKRARDDSIGSAGDEAFSLSMLDQPTSRWTPVLLKLLDEQRELCMRLESLSREQTSHVEAGRTDALIGVLSDRQRVIDRVVEINDRLEPFRSRREALMNRMSSGEQQGVQVRIDAIADSVERVRARDDADRLALEKQRSIVGDELTSLTRGRGAMTAYGSPSASARADGGNVTGLQDRQG